MRDMMEAVSVGSDWRLLSCAYVKFLVTRDHQNRRLLERHPMDLSVSVGRLAFTVIDEVYFPYAFGVETDSSYRAVDSLRRTNPEFGAAWVRRHRYRRQGLGLTLRHIQRSRHVGADIARMLCASSAHLHRADNPSVLGCDLVPVMLFDLSTRLCRSGEHPTDP